MLSEKIVLNAAEKARAKNSGQDFMFVRFANVLGSRGSILPLFMDQIKNGGPVTVTDEKMERYFMTIPEACSLVLQAGGVGKNAESYLLDMGEPVKIIDLARQIIKFSGFEPEKEISIKVIGRRPGERLTEPLWLKEENPVPTEYKKILKLTALPFSQKELTELLDELSKICFYSDEHSELFWNREKLLEILIISFKTLRDFYREEKLSKNDGKVVL